MSSKYVHFTPVNIAILLVDHQPGVLAMAKSVPAETVTANAVLLAGLAEQLNILLAIATTREDVDVLGSTLPLGRRRRCRPIPAASAALAC